jgi:hypothetical protein
MPKGRLPCYQCPGWPQETGRFGKARMERTSERDGVQRGSVQHCSRLRKWLVMDPARRGLAEPIQQGVLAAGALPWRCRFGEVYATA